MKNNIVLIYIIGGVIAGILVGAFTNVTIPAAASQFIGVGLLAALDSVSGGINAQLGHRFRLNVFVLGFFGNAVLAAVLTYIGQRLGIDIYLAAAVVFGSRLFQNFSEIVRFLLTSRNKKDKIRKT